MLCGRKLAKNAERNAVVVVTGGGDRVTEASGTKAEVAHRILDLIPTPLE